MASEMLSHKQRYHKHIIDSLYLRGNTAPLYKFLNEGGRVEDLGAEAKYIYSCRAVVADIGLVKFLFERGATLKKEISFFLHTHDMPDEVFEWALEKNFDEFEADCPALFEVACNIKRFKRLIERGANVHAVLHEYSPKPLVIALAEAGFIEHIELIVEKGADINSVWRGDWIPLFAALNASTCKADAIERLVKLGADYRHKRKNGQTAIMTVASGFIPESDNVNKLKYLMSLYQGWVDEVDVYGNTALHLAANSSREVDVISLLLEKGFDAKLANKGGRTPIDMMIERKNPKLFEPFRRFV